MSDQALDTTDSAGTTDHRELRLFFRTGIRPTPVTEERLVPLAFARYDPLNARGPFPLVLHGESGPETPLTGIVNELTGQLEPGDDGERRRRILLRAERALRTASGDAVKALDRIEPAVRSAAPDTWSADSESAFAALREKLNGSTLQPYEPECLEVLAVRAAARALDAQAGWRGEVDLLQRRLRQIADVEASESDTAPEHLSQSTGGAFSAAFDFEAFGHLLEQAPHAARLDPERLDRITGALRALESLRSAFSDPEALLPIPVRQAESSMAERLEAATALARAMTLSQLESEDRFEPDRHGKVLNALGAGILGADDLRVIPPVLVSVDCGDLSGEDRDLLATMLSGHEPFKVLLRMTSVRDEANDPAWSLVDVAMMAPHACAAQTALSDAEGLLDALEVCMAHPGPALVAVYAPADYLTAAAATESRAVPSLLCRGASLPWKDRVSVARNPQPTRDWPEAEDLDHAFCWADFAVLLPRLARWVLPLPPEIPESGLVHAARYLELGEAESRKSIPVVHLASGTEKPGLAALAAPVMAMMASARDRWHRLRELGGVENSYALAAVKTVEEHHAAALEAALSESRARHEQDMEQAVSGLAQEIVSNIAASLLGGGGAPLPPASRTHQAAAEPARDTPRSPPAESPAAEEPSGGTDTDQPAAEEPLLLDEPWIETVRCTSCNECTDLNGLIFAYDANKQAVIKDAYAGPFRDIVRAAEKCPAAIIHPGRPLDPSEPHLDDLIERARPFQ